MQLFYQFTNIHGGVSKGNYESLNLALHVKDNPLHVAKNRSLTCKEFNIKNISFMNQVHECDVKVINNADKIPTCDGIITNQKNLALAVLSADCIPLLLYDSKTKAIGAIHAGRAGVFGNIAQNAINKMATEFGTNALHVKAFIGPCIHQCCYELSTNVLQEAKEKFALHVKQNRLDIKSILITQLQNLGVHVKDNSKCTCCNKEYFSYRRDGLTGRIAGIIMQRSF